MTDTVKDGNRGEWILKRKGLFHSSQRNAQVVVQLLVIKPWRHTDHMDHDVIQNPLSKILEKFQSRNFRRGPILEFYTSVLFLEIYTTSVL